MADLLVPVGSPVGGIQISKRFRDMGDGTFAEVFATVTASGGFLFHVGSAEGATHLHSAVLSMDDASQLVRDTDPQIEVGAEAQPSISITTDESGDPAHLHTMTVVYDYENKTFAVIAITDNDEDNHAASLIK